VHAFVRLIPATCAVRRLKRRAARETDSAKSAVADMAAVPVESSKFFSKEHSGVGKYDISHEIGRGSYGVVVAARHRATGEKVRRPSADATTQSPRTAPPAAARAC